MWNIGGKRNIKMDRSEICNLFINKHPDDIVRMTAEVARKLTTIYENDFGYKGLYFCMVGITSPDKTACASTKDYLVNLLTELKDNSEAKPHHLSTIQSMLFATQASISESIDDIHNKCIDSIEHALTASSQEPDINSNIYSCIDLWKKKWHNCSTSL